MSEARPLFVVFEGIDGSGKTTICGEVQRHYLEAGLPVIGLREPSDGPWGKRIREMIRSGSMPEPGEQLLLFMRDREDDVTSNVRPALEAGKIVLMDRYYHSNAAYQGALGLDAGHVIRENLRKGFPEPDRVYLVDLDAAEALRRVRGRDGAEGGRDAFENEKFLSAVRQAYLSMADRSFLVLDGRLAVRDIVEIVVRDIDSLLGE